VIGAFGSGTGLLVGAAAKVTVTLTVCAASAAISGVCSGVEETWPSTYLKYWKIGTLEGGSPTEPSVTSLSSSCVDEGVPEKVQFGGAPPVAG
jgi:hypothetical protein